MYMQINIYIYIYTYIYTCIYICTFTFMINKKDKVDYTKPQLEVSQMSIF
jgi:phosphotransferase system  glucose/maltose/N-acetylglucosamine-specific IIC component